MTKAKAAEIRARIELRTALRAVASNKAINERAARGSLEELLDKFRQNGWRVAVHNDYSKDGEWHTFWLFAKGNQCIKGEAKTDIEALQIARKEVRRVAERWQGDDPCAP